MIPQPAPLAVVVFAIFVAITLGLSFYFGAKAKSADGSQGSTASSAARGG